MSSTPPRMMMIERRYPSLANRLLHELPALSEVSGPAAWVLISIAEHSRPDGTGAFPSIATLALMSHLHRSSVMRAIGRLEELSIISTRKADGVPTRYTINLNRLHSGTGSREEPVAESDSTGSREEPQPVAESDPNLPVTSKEPPSGKNGTRLAWIKKEWNLVAADLNLTPIRGLSPARRKTVKARLSEYSEDDMRTVLNAPRESPLLRGEVKGNGHDNFKAKFDWLMKPDNFLKTLEGSYVGKADTVTDKNAEMLAMFGETP